MGCPIKTKTLDFLKDNKAIGEKRVILDYNKFNELNDTLTQLALDKYNVGLRGEKLFTSTSNYIKLPDGNIKYIVRAEVNDKLFDSLQEAVDNYDDNIFEKKINDVDYTLKAVDILQSSKAIDIFNKGNKNGWTLEKILYELQIPRSQIDIILDKNINDREEIITSLLADNSFTVEISTSVGNKNSNIRPTEIREIEPGLFEYANMNFYSIEEALEVKRQDNEKYKNEPTSFYSNQTVPGGTNGSYIEANIETPMIVPSIQSHAQFKTDNTIGWMRADEKQNYQEKDIDNLIEIMKKSGILEVNCN